MPRKVKCQATGEYGLSNEFIKIGKEYYKSQEVYDEMIADREARKELESILIEDFLAYKPGQKYPAFVKSKLKELSYYSNQVILQTIKEQYNSIRKALDTKTFSSDYNKNAYIFAIISNNINDVYKREKRRKLEAKKLKAKDDELNDLAATLNEGVAASNPKQKVKDLSSLLFDE